MRIGQSQDIHRLVENRDLILGGVKIPYEKGLLGHSDADVLIHAIIEAIIGAMGLGDIGKHFPDNDDKYKDISSILLLKETKKLLIDNNYQIVNIDSLVIIEKPKLAPYIDEMKVNIASCLDIDINRINIKATCAEKLGFVGKGEGAIAQAIVLIDDIKKDV